MDVYAIVWERFAANSISCCWFAGSRFSGIWGKAIVNEAISDARQMSDASRVAESLGYPIAAPGLEWAGGRLQRLGEQNL